MNREIHVRFWESPELKVLRATRQTDLVLLRVSDNLEDCDCQEAYYQNPPARGEVMESPESITPFRGGLLWWVR